MKPQLAALAKKHGDKVVVILVDVRQDSVFATRQNVKGIPDTRLFYGGKQLEQAMGGFSMSHYEKWVLKHEKLLPEPLNSVPSRSDPTIPAIVPMDDNWLPPGITPAS